MKRSYTFHDFHKLILFGKQRLLTLGEYDRKPFTCKHCRRVIIQHFFKSHTLSKL